MSIIHSFAKTGAWDYRGVIAPDFDTWGEKNFN